MNKNKILEKIKTEHIILLSFFLLKLIISLFPVEYGFFRDEFYYMAMSENIDFGFLDVPPLAPFLLFIVRSIFGISYFSLHILPAISGCIILYIVFLIVKELKGNLFALILTLTAVTLSPQFSAITSFYSYDYLDMLFWILSMYFIFKLIKTKNLNYWIYFGITAGFGLLSKITILFLGFSIIAAMLLTRNRKLIFNWKFLLGGLTAILIFSPYIIWQLINGVPAVEYYLNYSSSKAAGTDLLSYLLNHIITMNPVSVIIWILGIYYFLFSKNGKQYRCFGFLFFILSAICIFIKSKYYLTSPIFFILFAGGSVFLGELFDKTKNKFLHFLKYYYLANIIIAGLLITPITRPILPVKMLIKYLNIAKLDKQVKYEHHKTEGLPQNIADRFGWPEMTEKIHNAYLLLSEEEKSECTIITDNYGEAGAIEHFGKKYNLPKPVSGHLQYYLWGTRGYSGEISIILTNAAQNILNNLYQEVKAVDQGIHKYAMPYENETKIYICKKPKMSLKDLLEFAKHFD